MADITRTLFGSTDHQGCVPSNALADGPVYSDDGRLIMSTSWTTCKTTDEANATLATFKDDHLVEAWRVWDCYAKDWAPCDVTVLRYESADVVVRNAGDTTNVWVGAIDTRARILASEDPEVNDECCWQWLRDDERP